MLKHLLTVFTRENLVAFGASFLIAVGWSLRNAPAERDRQTRVEVFLG
jgi:hypothetical protein